MKKRAKLYAIIVIVLILLIVVFQVVRANSYALAWRSVGIQSEPFVIYDGKNNNGQEFKVVVEYAVRENGPLVYLEKGRTGFWKAMVVDEKPSDKTGMLTWGWTRVAGGRRYSAMDEHVVEWEIHRVYSGNNAIKRIEIPAQLLPANVTVNIHQAGSAYILHFITYGKGEELNAINAYELLLQAGCVG